MGWAAALVSGEGVSLLPAQLVFSVRLTCHIGLALLKSALTQLAGVTDANMHCVFCRDLFDTVCCG